MATVYGLGSVHPDVAKIQAFLLRLHRADPKRYKDPGNITGEFNATTRAALMTFQRLVKIPATGTWGDVTRKAVSNLTKYMTGGKTSNFALGFNTLAEDRAYIIKHFKYVYDRPPTEAELAHHVRLLQGGSTRSWWSAALEKHDSTGAVTRMFKELLGREPSAAEIAKYGKAISSGTMDRSTLRATLTSSPEYLLKEPGDAEPTEGQEDARVRLNELLDEMGLGTLKDWAWQQIKDGHSDVRIIQDLRQTDAYKARFSGLVARVEAGLPAMSEAEYLDYEETAHQLMRQHGLPEEMRSQSVFADLIASNVSLAELNERIQEGFVRVTQAPVQVRNQFMEWFGPSGDAALAAFFLDPERATPALRRMAAASEIGGWGDRFGMGFTQARAEEIAAAGVEGDEVQTGLANLDELDPLFAETVSEGQDLTAEDQGADAVWQLGGGGAQVLERRARERTAATSGGGGAMIGQRGIGVGAAE